MSMKILSLDSSGMTASVAILEDERLLAEYTVRWPQVPALLPD